MPQGPPQGPPSRREHQAWGVKKWDRIRDAQAQVQRDAARQPSSRRNAGQFPGPGPRRKGAGDLRSMARGRLRRM